MNPTLPLTNPSSFTFLHHQPPPPPSLPNPASLSTTLTTLKNLISLSHHTLTTCPSLSTFLSSSSKPNNNNDLISCPYNRHHLMPPQHLFNHSLTCPTPIEIHLGSLRYPHTLNILPPESQSQHSHISVSGEELCFSVADYFDGSNFFYRDCPGVVSSLSFGDDHGGDAELMFTLPAVLSVECDNLISSTSCCSNNIEMLIDCCEIKFLASDIWAIRSEVEMWNDHTSMYSYNVLNAIVYVSSMINKESHLKRWIIVNSPRYGVVIDESMREHIFLLFRLSLKAIVREAFGSASRVKSTEGNERMLKVNLKSMHFNCPVLVEVLKWLSSQFSILYGEANGRLFAINLFKQYLFGLDSSCLLFSMEKKEMESTTFICSTSLASNACHSEVAKLVSSGEKSRDQGLGERDKIMKEIFVYQVAAAVAALHERALLEEKIKSLRLVQPFPRYQIVTQHAYVSKRAEEERQKRANYRSIVEHDGIMQRAYNQETNKSKTREELLAEERDYKRRRMSYHGKKLKRTKLQVVRDIIDEYMGEIKSAGGIGCFVKESEEEIVSSEQYPIQYGAPVERKIHDSLDSCTESVQGYREQSNPVHIIKSSQDDYDQLKQGLHGYSEPPEEYTKVDRTKKDSARNQEGYRSHGRYNEQSNRRREQDNMKVDTLKHHKDTRVSSSMSKYKDTRSSSSRSSSVKDKSYERKSNDKLETEDTYRRTTYRSHKSDSVKRNRYDDRYDPSESHDDVDSDSNYSYKRKRDERKNYHHDSD